MGNVPTETETAVQPKLSTFSFSRVNVVDPAAAGDPPVQPKLTMGKPNNPFEQEANAVAQQVGQRIYNPQVSQDGLGIQRTVTPQVSQLPIQRQSTIPVGPASHEFEQSLNQARSGGGPLEPKIQTKMESAMGADFSRVKVHTDAHADQLSRSIQAKAFTTGNDVFFKQGAYSPGSRSGQELLAHELTHVVQQGSAPPSVQRDDEDFQMSGNPLWNPQLQDKNDPVQWNTNPLWQSGNNQTENNQTKQENSKQNDEPKQENSKQDKDDSVKWTTNPLWQPENQSSPQSSPQEDTEQETEELEEEEVDKLHTISDSLKAVTKAYKAADDNTLSIEKLKYAFEEDRGIIEPFKDVTSEDAVTTLQNCESSKKDIKKRLKQKNLDKETKESLKEDLYNHERTLEYLYGFTKYDLPWPGEWKKANKRVADADSAHKYAFEKKTYVLVFLKQVQALKDKYSEKTKNLSLGQQLAKRDAKEEAGDLAKKSNQIAANIKERLGKLKVEKKILISQDRMAPGFVASIRGKDNCGLIKYSKKKGWPKTKEKLLDFLEGIRSGGYKKVVGENDKRGFAKPLRKTNIKEEAKAAYKTIQNEFNALQSLDVRSGAQLFLDCQVLVFQTADKALLANLKRVISFLKLYATVLQAVPFLTVIMEAIKGVLSIISIAISALQSVINLIVTGIRTAQALAGSPVVYNLLKASALNATIDSFASVTKLIGTILETAHSSGNNPMDNDKVPKTKFLGVKTDEQEIQGPSKNELINYGGVKPGVTAGKVLGKELFDEVQGVKNYNSVKKEELGKGPKNEKNQKGDEDKFVPHDEAVISVTSDALKAVIGKFGLFKKDANQMEQGLDKGTNEMDKAQKAAQRENVSPENQEMLKDTEEANSTMKTSKSAFELLKGLVS
ncbi:MAG: DUF4157 domain-containing protein [Cyanobacteria bacterium J06632_22]